MRHQIHRRNLDDGFRGGHPGHGGPCHPFGEQTQNQLISKQSQLLRVKRAGNDDVCHTVAPSPTPHQWIFGVIGEGRDLIHSCFDIGRRARHIPAGFKFQ